MIAMCRTLGLLLACMTGWMLSLPRTSTAAPQLSTRLSPSADPEAVANRVRSILSNRCFACHGPDEAERQAGFRLDEARSYLAPADSGLPPVVPGASSESEVLRRVASTDESTRMPPADFGSPLTAEEILLVEQWIEHGAKLPQHWAFVPPTAVAIPSHPMPHDEPLAADRHPLAAAWQEHPVDRFILAKQLEQGLEPSPEATRAELLRRLSLDLTGLPPTRDEVQAFEQDAAPDSYERQVERLLASPAYGEHWARKWLDLARYADSAGYADDPPRTIWAYRDWVIKALNGNMPYDQFTIEQLAGDLLPNPTESQLIATAFHRNTLTNNEGGTNDEEFRNVAVVDRVNTTMAVWMGVTMACAQCHTHKYDPLTHEEYFKLFAIFNQSEDADRRDESPFIELFTEEQKQQKAQWEQRLAELEHLLSVPGPTSCEEFKLWNEQIGEPEWNRRLPAAIDVSTEHDTTLVAGTTDGADDRAGQVRIRFDGETPDQATYRLRFPLPAGEVPLTALSIETLPEEEWSGAGFGGGNFVLSSVNAWLEPPTPAKTVQARYVRIALSGEERILSLAEVEVFANGQNVALGGSASQSSTSYAGDASRAIDGITDGTYTKNSTTHTKTEREPWWELDLGSEVSIEKYTVWNRTDNGLQARLDGAVIQLLNADRKPVYSQTLEKGPTSNHTAEITTRRPVAFEQAVADYEQAGFPAAAAIDNDPQSGWAVAGKANEPHRLILLLKEPVTIAEPQALVLELQHRSPYQRHLLGSFAVTTTNNPLAADWARLPQPLQAALRSEAHRTAAHELLRSYFHRELAAGTQPLRTERQTLQAQLQALQPATSVPVMRDLPADQGRQTFVQLRGNYKSLGQAVTPGTPEVFHKLTVAGDRVDRLALAHWLVDRRNPLTARVFVNRLWEALFGLGIVRSSEEFGSQGDSPTHPELLDWLAIEAMEGGWDMKRMLRTLVTSQTYRQTSKVSVERLDRDRENVWLARGPRVRLSAEMIRDQALSTANLLARRMHGPPVRPPQPNLGLTAAFGSNTDWTASEGEDRYRRGLYTTWRRSNPYPSMATFDAPSREVCTLRRDSTNTPLQALVTLNDPAFVEAAQALARRIVLFDETSRSGAIDDQLNYAFQLCTSRSASQAELAALRELLEEAQTQLESDSESARQLSSDPLGPLPADVDPVQLASWTAVCNVLLNLDEVLMKR
jgi:mono/diheme cytochrome c family protein